MRSTIKASVSALVTGAVLATGAFADGHSEPLTGDLKIFSDMSNPAPRAVMEGMVERFGALNPDLNINEAVAHINALERKLKERIPKLKWCFVEPDVAD